MPRAFDPANYEANFSPLLKKLNWQVGDLATDFAEFLIQASEAMGQAIINEIKSLTGIALDDFNGFLGGLVSAITGGDVSSAEISDLLSALEQIIPKLLIQVAQSIIGGIVDDGATALENFFDGFGGEGSLIAQMIAGLVADPIDFAATVVGLGKAILVAVAKAIVGGVVTDGEAALSNFFSGFGSGSSILAQLNSAFGGSGTTLEDLGILFVALGSSALTTLLGLVGQVNVNSFANWLEQGIAGQIAPGRLGLVPVSQVGAANPNLLNNPGFDTAESIGFAPGWTWNASDGRSTLGCVECAADGTEHILVSNVIQVAPEQQILGGIYVKYLGVTATPGIGVTSPIRLHLTSYLSGEWVSSTFLQGIAAPSGDSTSPTWAQISNNHTIPSSGVDSVVLQIVVDSTATAGNVLFDDGSMQKEGLLQQSLVTDLVTGLAALLSLVTWQSFLDAVTRAGTDLGTVAGIAGMLANLDLTGLFSASALKDIEDIPQLLVGSVAGIAGILDIGTAAQLTWDQLTSAYTSGGGVVGAALADLATAAQQTWQNALDALGLGKTNTNTLGIVTNKSVSAGLEATVESNMSLQTLGSGSTPSSVSVTQAVSAGGFLRCSQAKDFGFVQWYGKGVTGITSFFVNLYKMDSSGNLDLLFSSTDLHTSLGSSFQWQTYTFPGIDDIAVNPGDVIGVEFQVVGSGAYTIAGIGMAWQTNHPTADTKQSGFTHNWSTGAASTITAGSVTFTGNTPYLGLGVSNVPPGFEPPATTTYPVAGTFTYAIPSYIQDGDFIDAIAIGGGSSGSKAGGILPGLGGIPGNWNAVTYVMGVDIPHGATSLAVTVGAGGVSNGSQTSYHSGAASTVSGTGVTTLTATGGSGSLTVIENGPGPGNEEFNGLTYFGGSTVALGATGSTPGGAGGGGVPFSNNGMPGAPGRVFIVARQS